MLAALARRMQTVPLRTAGTSLHKSYSSPGASAPSLKALAFSRAAFGPTPGDVADFLSMGSTDAERFEAWVDRQLEPDSIADSELEGKLTESRYETLDKTVNELWVDHLLEDEDVDYRLLPVWESQHAVILRAIYSRRQLAEVLADFWHNHFNVYGWHEYVGPVFVHYDRDVIRANMLGNFRDFIEAMTISPAMLIYLDNAFSSADGPNENFARELLELHTLGEDNYFGAIPATEVPAYPSGVPMGYVDEDVRELARCLTGWTLNADTGDFFYYSNYHDHDAKRVLGLDIPAAQPDLEDGRDVLDLLAVHPGTARFVCTKLCRRLVADDPPTSLVQRATDVFLSAADQPDQLKRVVRTILLSDELATTWGGKTKRPFELVVGAVRAMDPTFAMPVGDDLSNAVFYLLYSTGNLPYAWAPPTGYPDRMEDWQTTNALMASWRMINYLTGFEYGYSRPCDPYRTTPSDLRSANELADYWIDRVLGRPMDDGDRRIVVDFLAQGGDPSQDLDLSDEDVRDRLRSMVGLILISPEGHWR
jgi:hypothetical protein